MSINACDINVSILFSLLLSNIRILLCFFFLFLVMLSNFLIIPVVREKIKVRLTPAIHIGASKILAEEIMQIPPPVVLKTIKILSV